MRHPKIIIAGIGIALAAAGGTTAAAVTSSAASTTRQPSPRPPRSRAPRRPYVLRTRWSEARPRPS